MMQTTASMIPSKSSVLLELTTADISVGATSEVAVEPLLSEPPVITDMPVDDMACILVISMRLLLDFSVTAIVVVVLFRRFTFRPCPLPFLRPRDLDCLFRGFLVVGGSTFEAA